MERQSSKLPAFKKATFLTVLACMPLLGHSDDSIVVFGLTNQALNGASLLPRESYTGLRVEGLLEDGHQGVSVLLGQADSGLFFSPQLNEQPSDGNFMK